MLQFDSLKMGKILVVAAHPDDEMLGCGGTLARFAKMGASVTILLLGEGPFARSGTSEGREEIIHDAVSSAQQAASCLGITDIHFASFPDNKFDTIPFLDIVQFIERESAQLAPNLVFTHHAGDLNLDHRLTHQAVMTAFRPLPEKKVPVILAFEVLSSTEYAAPGSLPPFLPTTFVDISSTLGDKQKALSCYASEMRPFPHPRSHEVVEHLARLRGSQSSVEAAEAFMLCREVFY